MDCLLSQSQYCIATDLVARPPVGHWLALMGLENVQKGVVPESVCCQHLLLFRGTFYAIAMVWGCSSSGYEGGHESMAVSHKA